MKNALKKVTSSVVASALGVSALTSFAAAAASNQPRIYATISYVDENTSKVNIYLENFPEIKSGGFHVELGDGFKVKVNPNIGAVEKDIETIGFQYFSSHINVDQRFNGVFIDFMGDKCIDPDIFAPDLTCFYSFYVEKTDVNTSDNSTATIKFMTDEYYYDHITDDHGQFGDFYVGADKVETPIMLKSDEYIVGDVTNDGLVDADDASEILTAIRKNANVKITTNYVDEYFFRLFPSAKNQEVPDVTKDTIINKTDAEEIMNYYSAMATGQPYSGYCGTIDVYEYYQD